MTKPTVDEDAVVHGAQIGGRLAKPSLTPGLHFPVSNGVTLKPDPWELARGFVCRGSVRAGSCGT